MRFFFWLLIGLLGVLFLFEYSFSHPQATSAALLAQIPSEDDFVVPVSPTPVWPFAQQVVSDSSASTSGTPGPHPSPLLTEGGRKSSQKGDSAGDFCVDVPVVLYHHVQPLQEAQLLGHAQLTVDSEIFEKQMQYLVDHEYNAISADDLVTALLNHEELPQKSIVITIDDGYIDNYSYAFMMAKKYHLIMNFMVPSELIGKTDYMTWDHLKEMKDNPYARIYNHTASHAALGLLDKEKIDSELERSNKQFNDELGLAMTIFTYPYGSNSPLAVEELKSHGFVGAFTTMPGRKQCESEIMLLHRDHIGNAPLDEYGL